VIVFESAQQHIHVLISRCRHPDGGSQTDNSYLKSMLISYKDHELI